MEDLSDGERFDYDRPALESMADVERLIASIGSDLNITSHSQLNTIGHHWQDRLDLDLDNFEANCSTDLSDYSIRSDNITASNDVDIDHLLNNEIKQNSSSTEIRALSSGSIFRADRLSSSTPNNVDNASYIGNSAPHIATIDETHSNSSLIASMSGRFGSFDGRCLLSSTAARARSLSPPPTSAIVFPSAVNLATDLLVKQSRLDSDIHQREHYQQQINSLLAEKSQLARAVSLHSSYSSLILSLFKTRSSSHLLSHFYLCHFLFLTSILTSIN